MSEITPAQHEQQERQPRPGLRIDWDDDASAEAKERYGLTTDRMQNAMRGIGLDADAIDNTCLMLLDNPGRRNESGNLDGGFASSGEITEDDGSVTRYEHFVGIAVRNPDGTYKSAEELNRALMHELTHVRQRELGTIDVHNRHFKYTDPEQSQVKPVARLGRIGMAGTVAVNWISTAASSMLDLRRVPGHQLIERFADLPTAHTLGVLGMGVVAAAATVAAYHAHRNMNKVVGRLFHKINSAEQEARANEHLADHYPVFEENNPA